MRSDFNSYDNHLSSVDFKSISKKKTCVFPSVVVDLKEHGSVVTPIGVIICVDLVATSNGTRKECLRLTNSNAWERFSSMNRPLYIIPEPYIIDMVIVGDFLVSFSPHALHNEFEKIDIRNGDKWESVTMNKVFLDYCVTKWDEQSVLITGGKSPEGDYISVSNTNIDLVN